MRSIRPFRRFALVASTFALLAAVGAAAQPRDQQAPPAAPASEDEAARRDALDFEPHAARLRRRARVAQVPGAADGHAGLRRVGEVGGDLLAGWNITPAGDQGGWLQKFPNPYTLVLSPGELSLERADR